MPVRFPTADPLDLRDAARWGVEPHQYRYISSVGHMTHPDDAVEPVECCRFTEDHSVHRRVLSCGEGWCLHRDGKHEVGPFVSETKAFGVLLRLQPMSTDWACKHEGWSFSPPEPCDLCVVIRANPGACPGCMRHCEQGEHCTATGADCAAAANSADHPSGCELCGAPLHGLVGAL